jgi:nitronate monooxygenase
MLELDREMWTSTAITRKLGIEYPIIQGPFGGGLSSVELVSSVSNAGGIGIFGANSLSPKQIVQVSRDIVSRTEKPFGLNLWVSGAAQPMPSAEDFERACSLFDPYWHELGIGRPVRPRFFAQDYEAQLEAVLEAKPHVVSFVFGAPAQEAIQACYGRKIFTIGTATNVDEARQLEEVGIDAVIATGFEAGGHRPSFLMKAEASLIGTLALVPQVVDAVRVPVIAAGGIADGRGIAAALALGAQAVQMGTAFLACEESAVSSIHRDMLLQAKVTDTRLTRVFSGRLLRAIRNRLMDEMETRSPELLSYPFQNWLTGTLRKTAAKQGRGDLLSLQAGQISPLLKQAHAARLVIDLVHQTTEVIGRLAHQS